MSKETLEFLLDLLSKVQIGLADPDFEKVSQRAITAKREVMQALEKHES